MLSTQFGVDCHPRVAARPWLVLTVSSLPYLCIPFKICIPFKASLIALAHVEERKLAAARDEIAIWKVGVQFHI